MSICKNLICQLVDSEADSKLKRLKPGEVFGVEKPGGEARIYIGQISNEDELDRFFGFDHDEIVKFKVCKSELLEYLLQARDEFLHPQNSYRLNISEYYNSFLDQTIALDEEFTIEFKKNTDKRYYLSPIIKGGNPYGKNIRSICLPLLTMYNFIKTVDDEDNVKYYFKLIYTGNRHPVQTKNIDVNLSKVSKSNIDLLCAIHTKPFLILGGFSGTGKSQKVKELAYLTCPKELQDEKKPGNYTLISVKPNWHDSTELLGYESTISRRYIATDFIRFIVKAMQYPDTPFYCCLDEMNLAPVEEYFAEYLSVIESRKKVMGEDGKYHIISDSLISADVFKKKYKEDIFEDLGLKKIGQTVSSIESEKVGGDIHKTDEKYERQDIVDNLKKEGLCIPENLVVIGTVNMDDTTNSFSRKVIDRAMIFETDIEKFDKDSYFNGNDNLQYGNVNGKPFICDEVRADKAIEDGSYALSDEDQEAIIGFINELNEAMSGTSFQVSYRVLNEMILYYRSMQILNDGMASLDQVKNNILMMKVLPRIEGDFAARKALEGLRTFLNKQIPDEWAIGDKSWTSEEIAVKPDTPWKSSILKVKEMIALHDSGDGFTRFWK